MKVLLITALALASASAQSINTNPVAAYLGELCHNNTRHCLDEGAQCGPDDKCTCTHGRQGDGALFCFDDGYTCAILNDPKAMTTSHQEVDVPLPCRFLLSHAITNIIGGNKPGTCDLRVYAVNERVYGKYFTSGFDLHVRVHYTNGDMDSFGFRALGRARNTNYQFKLWQTQDDHRDFSRWTLNTNSLHRISNVRTAFEIGDDMRVHLLLSACGIRIYFRPAESNLGKNQARLPGLAVNYAQAHTPTFASNHSVICLNPGYYLASVSVPLNVDDVTAMVHRAIVQRTDQRFLRNPRTQCEGLAQIMEDCPTANVKEALINCAFILVKPHFARCWNRGEGWYGSEDSLELLETCYTAFCERSVSSCQTVVNTINNSDCWHRAPETIRDFQCNFD